MDDLKLDENQWVSDINCNIVTLPPPLKKNLQGMTNYVGFNT